MAIKPENLDNNSIKINENYPHAFCLIRVELDQEGKPEDWTFLSCNELCAKLEGLTKEELIGHRFFELFPNGSRKWLKPYYESAYEGKLLSFDEISEEVGSYLHIEVFPAEKAGTCMCILRNVTADIIEKANRSDELREAVEKLEEERRIRKQVQQYADAMGVVYPLAISLDYIKNEYWMLEYEQFLNKTAKWSGTVDELIEVGASTIPDEKYAKEFKDIFGRKNALAAFRAGKKELTLKHPQWGDDGKIHWMETKVICSECTDTKAEAISVSKCIDDERQIEEAKEQLQEQFAIINSLSDDYVTIYIANINNGTARAIRIADYLDFGDISAITNGEFSIDAAVRQWIELNVNPADKERMLEMSDLGKVREALETQNEYVGIYQSNEKEGNHNYQFTIKKIDDAGNVIVGFKLIDAIIESRMEAEKKEKQMLEEHRLQMQEQLAVFNVLARNFKNVYMVDLNNSTAKVLKLGDEFVNGRLDEVMNQTFPYEGFLNAWISDAVHPDDREMLKNALSVAHLREVFSTRTEYIGNYHMLIDGQVFNYQFSLSATDQEGHIVAGFQNIDAIIEEHEAQAKRERELEELHLKEEREHAEVVNSLSTIYSTIFRADVDTHEYEILASVPLMRKVAAATGNFDDVKAKIIESFMEPEFRNPLSEFLDLNTLADRLERVNTVTIDYKAPTGRWMQARFIAKRRNENGRAKEILYVARDITEEKNKDLKQQEELARALVAAQQANKAKTTFLNSMSHDIRTPMNAIVGFTALAQTHIDDQKLVQDYLGKISTSSTHLLSLINDILDMSRIESGTVKLDEKAVHIPDLLHDLRTMIQSLVNSKNLNLFIDTQDVVHEDVLTDKLRLNQVLLNIVSNAIKFTQPGGDIIIHLVEKPCGLKHYTTYEFSVKDNGIGMSQDFLGHIFETFTRERSATVSGVQGTGLGMAITKNIVDMMGGNIKVESEEGKGSTFVVTLNLRLANEPVKNEPISALLGARALIVDDDINTCRSVSKMLRDIEMRPDWTASGKEAILRAQDAAEIKDEYKVYIVDYLMPDMNGIETVRRIRKVISEDVPIIVLTAYDWTDFEYEARQAGVTAFVSKPIFMSELRAVLTQPAIKEGIEKGNEEKKTYDYSGKHILLVEDNELNREIATAILEETGMTIDSVEDGDIAVATINKEPAGKYDLILMDVQMPKMDGYTATREIRTLPDNRKANTPIVAMTANAFDEDRKKAFEAGMNGHIIKPISIEEIAKVLDEIFAEKK